MAATKVCHRFSRLSEPTTSPITGKSAPMLMEVPCLGPRCALFLQPTDEKGNIVVGAPGTCADVSNAIAAMRIGMATETLADGGDDEGDESEAEAPTLDPTPRPLKS